MLPRANDDSAARLLLAEHSEERGDVRMARAWRWMAVKNVQTAHVRRAIRTAFFLYPQAPDTDHERLTRASMGEIESAVADALERGEL